jgi:hypothetical protein
VSCSDDLFTFIRVIRSTFLGGVPASSINSVIGIACLGAFAVRVRSPIGAISFEIYSSAICVAAVKIFPIHIVSTVISKQCSENYVYRGYPINLFGGCPG